MKRLWLLEHQNANVARIVTGVVVPRAVPLRFFWPFALLLLWDTITPRSAFAWSHQGHMATAAIAYDDLETSDTQVVAEVERLMAFHPDAARFRRNLAGFRGKTRSRELFKWMARWPDDVRGTSFDRPTWHYALRVVSSWSSFNRAEYGDARAAFAKNLKIAENETASPGQRAIALCWLFHIVGDMQQPLHAGHWASLRFPLTDRGGSRSMVRRASAAPFLQLHQFWDFAIDVMGPHGAAADIHAERIKREYPRTRLAELNQAVPITRQFGIWANESAALARRVAYRNDGLRAVTLFGGDPVVSNRYAKIANSLSSRRIADGGYRIADLMRRIIRPQ